MPAPDPRLLPILIGVSGHRDIPNGTDAELRRAFREYLLEKQRLYPNSPIIVMSGLASGCDSLAAEVALDLNIPVFAVLPMPLERYENDFDAAGKERLHSILGRCFKRTVVNDLPTPEENYVGLATYIAYYSHLLVVFWDGEEGRGPGGTADVVKMRKHGVLIEAAQSIAPYIPDVGPVDQIVTPRNGAKSPDRAFETVSTFPSRFDGDESLKADIESALKRFDTFNRDLARQPFDEGLDQWTSLIRRTDGAANDLQTKYLSTVKKLYLWAFAAGALQLIVVTFVGIFFKLIALLFAWRVFRRAHEEDYENRYQDYRALAEAAKVQRGWSKIGLWSLAESAYLRMQQSELQWIRMALRCAFAMYESEQPIGIALPDHAYANLNFTCSEFHDWLEEQRGYYRKAGKRQQAIIDKYAVMQKRAFVVAVVLTGIGAVLGLLTMRPTVTVSVYSFAFAAIMSALPSLSNPHGYISYLAEILTAAPLGIVALGALLVRFYIQQRGFQENIRRYHHMYIVFDTAARRLAASSDPRLSAQLVNELGIEALSEHANWLMLHRERPLSFVS